MEIFKLFGTIAINNDEANKAIDETTKGAENSGNKVGTVFSKIGSVAAKIGKTIGIGLAGASTAIIALGKSAISAYGDYEQLVGGVETLFKDSADTVIKNASTAYRRAGMSANEYMETVTSFSASLLQSLGNDSVAAAKKADMAIVDMSDNANKMGTSIESIQWAYQGFAKQNYMMLDNLKLGYGGTKEEMERLLEDATKLSGIEYDISSYADIVDAIHVIQTEMGITGTTAKEASSTIQGLISSLRAAWKNLLIGLTDETQDFDMLINNLFESLGTVGDNLIPRISTVLNGVANMVGQLAPKLMSKIPEIISTLLPAVVNGAVELLNAVVVILPQLADMIMTVLPSIIDAVEKIFMGIVDALPALMESICSALPTLIPKLITAIINMVVYLATHLIEIIQPLIDHLPEIIIAIVDGLMDNLPTLIEGCCQLVIGIVGALPQIIMGLIEAIPQIISRIVEGLWNAFPALLSGILEIMGQIISALWEFITGFVTTLFQWIVNIHSKIWEVINGYLKLYLNTIVSIFNAIKTTISNILTNVKNIVTNIFSNIKATIEDKINGAKTAVSNVFDNIKNTITNKLNSAKDSVWQIIERMKSFFNFTWSLPNIKLPHFSISPSGWNIGDLLKGSIPSLGIQWYAKAMDNGMIMNEPTIFGVNPKSGTLLAGGEAGSETVVGTQNLMDMIQTAVNSENNVLIQFFTRLIDLLEDFFPQVLENMGYDLVLDTGVLVAETAPQMDDELGKIFNRKGRQ